MVRHIIEHPDGRRYSVEPDAFHRYYEDQGFVLGDPEQPADFLADVPAPKARRRAPRAKNAAPVAAAPAVEPEATEPG